MAFSHLTKQKTLNGLLKDHSYIARNVALPQTTGTHLTPFKRDTNYREEISLKIVWT